MAYETKVILSGLAWSARQIAGSCNHPEAQKALARMYEAISEFANVEGIVLKPFEQKDDERS